MTSHKIIIVPGNGGASMDDHWFPYITAKFTEAGHEVIAKSFPDAYLARKEFWFPFIENVLQPNDQSILIGHSSGAEAVMRYAEEHALFGSVLVSPCHTDMGVREEKISGWYDDPWQWEKIKANQKFILQFSSTDDYIVPIAEQYFVRDHLQPEYHEFHDRGHFVVQSEFSELVDALLKHCS